jgi:hypothetical protein
VRAKVHQILSSGPIQPRQFFGLVESENFQNNLIKMLYKAKARLYFPRYRGEASESGSEIEK